MLDYVKLSKECLDLLSHHSGKDADPALTIPPELMAQVDAAQYSFHLGCCNQATIGLHAIASSCCTHVVVSVIRGVPVSVVDTY